METGRLRIWLAFFLVVDALLALGVAWTAAQLRSKVIYPGVSVAGLELGGSSIAQARAKLLSRNSELQATKVTLEVQGHEWVATIDDLGGSLDVDLCAQSAFAVGRSGSIIQRLEEIITARRKGINLPPVYKFNEIELSSYLSPVIKKIDRPARDARLSFSAGSIQIIADQPGLRINVEKSISHIKEVVNSGNNYARLVTEVVMPKVKAADFHGINGIIASYSTSYKTWERSRAHNIKRACRAIDGFLLKPGEVFSYNAVVGPRVRKNGYLDAPQFVRGKIIEGPGGGVCQVSTTLYNAVLLANLKVRERSHHSRPIAYVPLGRDATVEYGLLDLKFENTSGAPIYISASAERGRVDIKIFGKKSDQQVEILTTGHKIILPKVIEHPDSRLEAGESVVEQPGREGHHIEVYRIVRVGGKIVRKELISRNYYPPEPRIIAVGQKM